MTRDIIDVHSHIYLPRYMEILRLRTEPPRIFEMDGEFRLIILPGEELDCSTKKGRPIGKEYFDPQTKLEFMKIHGITKSVLSLGNPWLDFLDEKEAAPLAKDLNADLQEYCEEYSEHFYGFGVLPTSSPAECVMELERISKLDKLRGAIIGTHGCGKGLDDKTWEPVFAAAERLGLMLFLHPHYGISNEAYGDSSNGHVLPLGLGFPFETTIAVSRMILCGLFDRYPALKLLLAHAGGAIPFLAGRLDSCVQHDPHVAQRLQHLPSYYLKQLYYDAVNYHEHGLKNVESLVGRERVMFGTDNPFFPPLDQEQKSWESVNSNVRAIKMAFGHSDDILGGNAKKILNL